MFQYEQQSPQKFIWLQFVVYVCIGFMYGIVMDSAFILANSIRIYVWGYTVNTAILANSTRISFEAVILRTLKVD